MELIIILLLIPIVLLLLFVIISAFFFAIDAFLDLPYVATKKEKIATIIKLANIKSKETVVDLGSGDGRLLFAAAQKDARAIGYEINPFLILLTKLKWFLLHPRGRVEASPRLHPGGVIIKRQNLWKADLAVADVIFVYGRRKTMQKFEDFVYQNAKRGARVIVNTNPFPRKQPTRSQNGMFLYKV